MVTNQTINGKFAGVDVNEADLQSKMENFTSQASQSSAPALNVFAQIQQQRVQRLEAAAGSLETVLGPDHPQVQVLQQNAASAGDFTAYYTAQATRVDKRPKLHENEWMAYGRVIDAAGTPAVGLTVRVFDKDRKLDDLLGITETDESGDFFAVYHARDFFEPGENAPELYLMVEDENGKLLFSSRNNVRPEAGRSEYFLVQLSSTTGKNVIKKRGRPAKAASTKTGGASKAKSTRAVKGGSRSRKTKK